jgi:hypothetical protein
MDSNHDSQIQSLLSCHWTTGEPSHRVDIQIGSWRRQLDGDWVNSKRLIESACSLGRLVWGAHNSEDDEMIVPTIP